MSTSVTYAKENGEQTNGYLDKIDFGDTKSENAHNFKGDFTSVITGFMGEKARVSEPRIPASDTGGFLTFSMKVDPYLQNYFTVKVSGNDVVEPGVRSQLVINGEQVGYFRGGDYGPLIGGERAPNQFVYATVVLPLESTRGKEIVEITINTTDPWGTVDQPSRGYYTGYTHTQAYIDIDDEVQGYKFQENQGPETVLRSAETDEEIEARIAQLSQEPINAFMNHYNHLGNNPNNTLNIAKYTNALRFYAMVLKSDISPMKTPEAKREALMRMFQAIDVHTKNYYGNTRLVLHGGHQGDWGGFYGELGEALYLAETLIFDEDVLGEEAYNAFLDEPYDTGTEEGEFSLASAGWNGEPLTRRMAWERVLKANFDYARSKQSYITNQVFYTYEGAWKAHEGLRMVGSEFYEGRERSHRILLEMFGGTPWLGEEVLVGPNGEELDLYHDLFAHNQAAVFTDDYVHIVGKGIAKSKLDEEGNVVRRKPYGDQYTNITKAGLTRENHYVGIYGEVANYILDYFYKTLDQPGEEEINDELLKLALNNFYGRLWTRLQDLDDEGERHISMNATLDERNGGMPSRTIAYGARMLGYGTSYAYLEKYMADHEERFSGPEWDRYWEYAKYTVGAVQQMKMDNRLMGDLSSRDFNLADSYEYIFKTRKDYDRFDDVKAGVVIPQTDFDYYTEQEIAELGVNPEDYEQFAWIDVDTKFLSMRDGDFRMFGALSWLNMGTPATGRLHIITPEYVKIAYIAHNNQFQYEDYYIRQQDVDLYYQRNHPETRGFAPQSLAGEILPIAYQPGVGKVVRDNLEVDHPYGALTDLMAARYGEYFILLNTTRPEYQNESSFEVELPSDYTGNTIFDFVSKSNIPVVNGKVTIGPETGMVLKLSSKFDPAPKPNHVDFVKANEGNGYVDVIWKTTAGGKTYTLKRSESEHGPYAVIAEGLTGNHYKDTDVVNGNVYYYKVAAVNEHGSGWESWRAKADLSDAASKNLASPWQQDFIGTTQGSAAVIGDEITIQNVDGNGLGEGHDFNIYKRDINDSFHYVHQVAVGNSSISAKIDQNSGDLSGIMLREFLSENSRYLYFGADDQGNLVLQYRNRVSFGVWNGGIPVSPLNLEIKGYHVDDYPYVKVLWHHNSQFAHAFASKDGVEWEYIAKVDILLPYVYYTGLISSHEAAFSEVTVLDMPREDLMPFIAKDKDQITLHWNKPKQASWFNVYRTYDEEASLTDPVFKAGTTELEDGSPWEAVLTGTRAKPFQDSLRYGSAHYKVMAVHDDGSPQPFSTVVSVYADSISAVMEHAKSLPAYDYTKASFYQYHKVLDQIEAEMAGPEMDEAQLIDEIYEAKKLLVSVRTLLTKIQMDPSMVRASEKFWGNDNISEEQNGWFLFDENLDTIAHTRSAVSWVDVDFGAGNEKVIDTFRYLPRRTHARRILDTVFMGSNDGENWTDLHKIPHSSWMYEWYSAINPDKTPYRYIRIYDDHGGFVNFEEIEFLEIGIDKTLLAHLLDEAAAANEAGIYTAEGLQAVSMEAADAATVLDNAAALQEEIDAAVSRLFAALDALVYIEGMPVLESLRDRTVNAEKMLSFKVEAVNTDDAVVYGVQDLPQGASFDAATGIFEWIPGREQGGDHAVTFTAAAGNLSSSKTIRITVKGQPVFEQVTTVELTAQQPFQYALPVSDPAGEPLVYRASELPKGAMLDTAEGIFSWTPNQADYGSHPVTFTVSNRLFEVSQTIIFKVSLSVLPSEDYTRASYYLYLKEVERIQAEIAKPDADMDQLLAELNQAEELLVSVRTLLTKIQMDPSMVRASEQFWGNNNISEEQNGWYLFDEDPNTITHTRSAVSWVDVDFGAGNEKVIDTFRYLPRRTHVSRVNGTVFRGSNDGVNWTDLYKIPNTSVYQWYSALNPDKTPYRYIRIYDDHNGFVNFEEIEFLEIPVDQTLLTLLLDRAAEIAAEYYTTESFEAFQTAHMNAESAAGNADATQEEIDAAAASLLEAFEGLELIEGVPVLAPIGDKFVIAEQQLTFTVEEMNGMDGAQYEAADLPHGASFNAETRTFDWTPVKEQGGVHPVTFTVTSGALSTSRTVMITVKGLPVITAEPVVELTAKELLAYPLPVSDPSGAQLTYQAENLPAGASFNAATGVLSWTPGQADYGSHPVKFTVGNGSFEVSLTVDFNVKLNVIPPAGYTQGSYYLYLKEVARIEAEMTKPEANKALLAAELAQAEASLDQVPLSLYSFEGNAENAFGKHDGTAHGNVGYAEGKIGQAVNLNGTDGYLTLPSEHALSGSGEITVATWVNWRGGGNWQRIFDFGNNTNQFMFLTPKSGNNTLRFAIKNGGGEQMVQTASMPVNEWVHVAVTLGDNTAKLYVNGELMATNSNVTIKPSDFKPSVNYIGKSQWPDPLFNGMIDEFYIYNYALSEEEIQADYNNTAKWIDNTLIPVLLDEAAAIDTEAYTEESVEALQAAVTEAQSVYNNADATQEEIDAASATLKAALDGLQYPLSISLDPAEPNGLNGWYTVPVTVVLNSSAQAEYSLDGGNNWTAYEGPVMIGEDGIHQLLYRSTKDQGDVKSLEFNIDLTPPQVDIIGQSMYTIDQEIMITCVATDVTSSVYGAPCDQPLLQVMAYELEPGQHTVTVEVEDMAGNLQIAQWTFVIEATYDSMAVLSERFVTETAEPGSQGLADALRQKLMSAKRAYERENHEAAQDLLQSYIEQVEDLAGNKLSEEQASVLVHWVEQLLDTLSKQGEDDLLE